MSGFGVHAGLALAGVIAGLPVAAVVQWNREPPDEVWSLRGVDWSVVKVRDPTFDACARFADGPDGARVTSFTSSFWPIGDAGEYVLRAGVAVRYPRALPAVIGWCLGAQTERGYFLEYTREPVGSGAREEWIRAQVARR